MVNLFSLTEPFGPPSPLAPLSDTSDDQRVVELVDRLEVVQHPADLRVGVREEAGVHLGHPREQPAFVLGQVCPRLGVVQRRERLPARALPPGRCADGVQRRQLGVPGHDPEVLLAGQDLLAGRLVAGVEAAPVAVRPLLRHVVRCVRGAGREVEEEGPVGGDGPDVVDELDGVVGEVDAEVVALLRRARLVDRVVVVHEVRVPLVRLRAEEAVEPVEPTAERPAAPGRGDVHLVLGGQVPLAERAGAEALVDEHLRHRGALRGHVPVAVGEPGGRLGDARHAVRGVVAPGQQARPGGGAQRGRVPLREAQAGGGDAVDVGGADRAAVAAEAGEADVVQDHVEDVRRPLGRDGLLVRRPVGRRSRGCRGSRLRGRAWPWRAPRMDVPSTLRSHARKVIVPRG